MSSQYTEDEIKALAEKMYFELQTELYKREASNSEAFDKAILTYSAGALTLSLGFLRNLAVSNTHDGLSVLYWSWLLFVICITSTVGSFLFGKIANRAQLKKAECYYIHRDDVSYTKRNALSLVATAMNWLSGISFCVAALLTTLFVFNTVRSEVMANRSGPSQDTIQKIISGKTPIIKSIEPAHMPRLPTAAPQPAQTQAPQPVSSDTPSSDVSTNEPAAGASDNEH